MIGCWMNCVNTIGWPVNPPSICGKIGTTMGNRLTDAEDQVGQVAMPADRRTKSAESAGNHGLERHIGAELLRICVGREGELAVGAGDRARLMTKNWKSVTWSCAVWPLNIVSFGACMTLVRVSPWTASRNRNTWMSLRNPRPNVMPPKPGSPL